MPYIRSLPHSWFYCHFVFSMKSDGCNRMFSLLCCVMYIHQSECVLSLIGRDDENILSSCVDQSDDTIHLLRYIHTKQQSIWLHPSHQSNHTSSKNQNDNKTMNVAAEDRAYNCLFKGYAHGFVT